MIFLGHEQLLDPRQRVTITMQNANGEITTVQANMQSDITISGGNDFGDGLDIGESVGIVSGGAGSTIGGAINTIRDIRKVTQGRDLINVWETESIWRGSNKPTFELDLSFICLTTSGEMAVKTDVIDRVNKLMRAVYPDMQGEGKFTRIFNPPLGFTREDSDIGKITIKIGDWFYAKRLVAEACSFTYSKEVNRLGKPIYATGRFMVRPYRSISFKEFQKYFIG